MGHPSLRTCAGCRARRERLSLVRLHADAAGGVTISRPGAPGRGVYLCPRPDCLAKALAGKRLARALRRSAIRVEPDALTEALGQEIRRRFPAEAGEGAWPVHAEPRIVSRALPGMG